MRRRCGVAALLCWLVLRPGVARGDAPERLTLDGDAWQVHESIPGRWNSSRHLYLREPRKNPRGWLPNFARREAWIKATVPGAVVADLVAAGVLAEPFAGLQSRAAEWVSQRDWIYSRSVDVPEAWRGSRVRLRFEGIDPGGVVFLNGVELATHRGMFVPLEVEVTGQVRFGAANDLDVVVFHAPDQQPRIQSENEQTPWKARFATGWDFAPRLVPVGLWDSVELRRSGSCALTSVGARAVLEDDRGHVPYRALVSCASGGATVEAVLRWNGSVVARSSQGVPAAAEGDAAGSMRPVELNGRLTLLRPELWNPNGSGEQSLYEVELSVRDAQGVVSDRELRRVGFRAIRWVRAAGAGAGDLPYGAIVNGRPVFLKGWNWVPADQLYGRVGRSRYAELLGRLRDSNANLVRVWGGGLIEKEAFYDLADELGLMVWQESPLTSAGGRENLPGSSPDFLAATRDELARVVDRRRHHPSLSIWSGGNELVDDSWRPLGTEHPYSKAMREVLDALAPDLLALPSSPSGAVYFSSLEDRGRMGDVHGPWRYLGPDQHSAYYDAIDPMLHSEFGVASLTDLEAFAAIGPESAHWPPRGFDPVWSHHSGSWFDRAQAEALFGPALELKDAVRLTQFLQAEGLRYAVEAHRRRYPRTVGCLPWQFNEPWPAVAGTFSVDFRGEPKPSYWWVRRGYAARSLSATYPRISWRPGDEFGAELWFINEAGDVAGGTVWYRLDDETGRALAEAQSSLDAPGDSLSARPVAAIRHPLPTAPGQVLLLRAEVRDRHGRSLAEHRSLHVVTGTPDLKPLRSLAATEVAWTWLEDGRVEVRNLGPRLALGVQLFAVGAKLSDNYRTLAPGERWLVDVAPADRSAFRVDWWNR